MAEAGHTVVGVDTNADKVATIRSGQFDLERDYGSRAGKLIQSGQVVVTTNFDELAQADFISICVPTPLDGMKTPDLSYVRSATVEISRRLRPGQTVVLESTTFPGTTADLVRPILEESGLHAGVDFYLAYSPERVDPGNPHFDTQSTPKVVGADDQTSLQKIVDFYGSFIENVVPVTGTKTAEMTKLLENTFRAVNIAFVNELSIMCERLDINVWEVIDAAKTKPFGFMPFYPGPGIGGHCIPLDPLYLSWKAKSVNFFSRFIETAADINNNMPRHVVEKIIRMLGTAGVPGHLAKVLLLGMSYKPDVADYRESPSYEVMELLLHEGVQVAYHDPYVPSLPIGKHVMESVSLSDIEAYDCIVALVRHSAFDVSDIASRAKLIFDTRNMFQGIDGPIVRLGDGTRSQQSHGDGKHVVPLRG